MRAALAALVLLAGCAPDAPTGLSDDPPLAVRTWVEGRPESGVGTLKVQIDAEAGLDVPLPEPQVEGLRLSEVGEVQRERLGERVVITRTFRFTGEAGSYRIPPIEVTVPGDTDVPPARSAALWVDVGQPGPALDDLADIEEPPPVWRVDTALVVGAACAGITVLGAAGGAGLAFWGLGRRGRTRELPPEPPDVVALRRWEAVRSDDGLTDHDKAVAIAAIFRDYAEAVLGFPATAWTTSEILAHLGGLAHLPDGSVGRARRILRATDRIKFADSAARDTLFEELDDALRTFVGTTRPTSWDPTTDPEAP